MPLPSLWQTLGNPLLAVESARVLADGGSGPPPNLRTAVRATAGLLPAPARTLLALLAAAVAYGRYAPSPPARV